MDIGTRLKLARERQGKSLHDVAEATKISSATLEALENNRFARLPGGIFARSFVRACALEVGLDPEPVVQDFISSYPNAAPESLAALEATAPPRPSAGFRWVAIVGALTVLAAAAAGAYFWVASNGAVGNHAVPLSRGSR